MATAGDGSQAPTSSGYGGGGVGGKFDRRSFRRNRATPYDRPPTASRNPSWVSKLLVDPAKKLIASSANVFFSSVFRKSLPPPLSLPESNPESSDRIQAPDLHDEGPLAGADGHNSRGEDKSGVLELEELLKQKSFTRSEIDRLTDLLRSKVVDLPAEDVKSPETSLLNPVTDIQQHREYRESPLAGKGLKIERSQGLVSTPGISSRVLDEDIASPTELAKAYMERLPSKVSPSTLSWRSQPTRNDGALLSNSPFTPTSSVLPLAAKTTGHFELGKNGFTTPGSRGRSAIYSMARTPYSRGNPSTSGKAGGTSGYLFRSPTLSVRDGNLGSKKRGNSVLDDLGSGGPMRRTRQRNGLVSDKVAFSSRGKDVSKEVQKPSSLLHKHSFMNDWNDPRSKNLGDKALNAPSTSSHVHPRCSEVAARILQQLENISPKEKSAESKLNAAGERSSPSKLSTEMFSRPAPNNHQNAGSSKMPWSVQDHHKLDTSSNRELDGVHEGTSGLKESGEQNGPRKSYFQREMMNGDAEVSAKRVFTGTETSGPATISAAQQSPNFNAHEVSPGLAGDTCRNGLASEGRGQLQTSAASQQLDSAKSTKDNNPVVAELRKTPPESIFDKTSKLRSFGDGTAAFSAVPSSTTKLETVKLSPSVSASEKPKEVGESSSLALAAEAADMKASFSMQPKSLSSFSSGDGGGMTPQVPVPSKHGDSTTHEYAKSIEKTKPVQFGTFGSSTSSSTPAFSIFDNSKLKNNGTASISKSPFSSSPSISTDLTNQVVTNYASSSSTSSSALQPSSLSATAFKFGSSDKTSAASDAGARVTDKKVEKEAISISPDGGGSIFGSGTTGSSVFGSTASLSSTDPSHSQGTGKESILGVQSSGFGPGSSTVSQGTTPFEFGLSTSSPIFGKTGLTPVSSSSSSSATNLFISGQTYGLSSTTSSSESKPVVSATGGGASSTFAFAATMPATSSGAVVGFIAPNAFGFSSGSLTTSSVSSMVSSTSSSTPATFNFTANSSGNNISGSSASSFSSNLSSRLSASTDNSAVVPGTANSNPVFSWQNPNSTSAAATFNSSSPSTGFTSGSSSSPLFSFAAAAAVPSFATPSPMFGNQASSTFQINNNSDDSMAEDTLQQSSNPTVPAFGQPPAAAAASPSGFTFNSPVQSSSLFLFSGQPSQSPAQNPQFQFSGQPSQGGLQNSLFQGTGSLEFSAGGGGSGSFVFGSGGEKSSGRKIVRVNRNKHRKK